MGLFYTRDPWLTRVFNDHESMAKVTKIVFIVKKRAIFDIITVPIHHPVEFR